MSDANQGVDQDATQFIPSPRRGGQPQQPATFNLSNLDSEQFAPIDFDTIDGLNSLVASANPILALIPRIRTLVSHPNPKQLRDSFAEKIVKFEQLARKKNVLSEDVLVARYALCTLIDEAIASTPWGGTAEIANRSLLVTFHQEAWGGEKFFQILNKLAENPVQKIDLIELFYVCLSLGFEGRFKIVDNGKFELQSLREKVSKLILNVKGEFETDLSAHWRGENTDKIKPSSYFHIWLAIAGLSLLLLILYALLAFNLSEKSDAVSFNKLAAIPPKPTEVVLQARVAPKISEFLLPEIKQGLVNVDDQPNMSKISIIGDGLFDSGNATLNDKYAPLLARIALALDAVSGQVLVAGHTDNQPSHSIRFPSNWYLSKARSENVSEFIKQSLKDPARLHFEGRGDSEPLVPNDSDSNRARNRRVEIILQVAG